MAYKIPVNVTVLEYREVAKLLKQTTLGTNAINYYGSYFLRYDVRLGTKIKARCSIARSVQTELKYPVWFHLCYSLEHNMTI